MGTIYIQMGHVPRKVGSTGTEGEQEFAKAVAARAARRLRRRGHRVFVRGADDPTIPTDVFVAIHADGSVNKDAHGASVGYQDRDGKRIAHAWKRAYQRLGWATGFRDDNYTEALAEYYGVRDALDAGTKFAFIIEAGFMTNPQEGKELRSPRGRARVARAISRAVRQTIGHPKEP